MKLPAGYASNIARHVQDRSIWGLKTQDYHMLMQHLLSIAICRVLPKNMVKVLIELSNVFRQLCSKLNNKCELEKIQDHLAVMMCHKEMTFPPSFFDIIENLPIHLAVEALMAGAVQF
ncbi:hypothetical protein ACH5RR_006725 [Cinchona calisaya]|uniref:DUF4218 domain-containing protein n=1 Tax=Cinchona calisaya TaxID=153742 RepID=A0ABD3APR9_9GENT